MVIFHSYVSLPEGIILLGEHVEPFMVCWEASVQLGGVFRDQTIPQLLSTPAEYVDIISSQIDEIVKEIGSIHYFAILVSYTRWPMVYYIASVVRSQYQVQDQWIIHL